MGLPQSRLGDINAVGAPVITTKTPNILVNGVPTTTLGDVVAPHFSDPVHISITTAVSNVLMNGFPSTQIGDPDTCGHARATGSLNVFVS